MTHDLAAVEKQLAEMRAQLDALQEKVPSNKLAMVVFSGDLDRALAAFIIATGAAAMDMEVVMFFTFWATPILRDPAKKVEDKDFMGKMFGTMLPKGARSVKLSKMNMGGLGTAMMKNLMKQKNVASLEQMIAVAGELGVRIYVCTLSMELMGFKREEMIAYPALDFCGVGTFLGEAMDSRVQLFI
ncbi:DsrE/DsrF/DrsH-like family protein [Desulfosoma caldarium]|uniref:Peroxiredoxin family protein n=1 Tax=Desulfosoma caldarium TaxID=610254 RepID=A0A3N1UQ72_9BACT|nr:DsrE/DsrF/DrsH-like family protein [Desulfosoma caldarium]ROQ90910.1 peroxiredoxin family protein [Desulfosoma caldarium]